MTKLKAFTFIELLIVIALIFTIYGLFFENFDFNKNEKKSVALEKIKPYLLNNFIFNKTLKLICIQEPDECFVFVDGEVSKENKIESLFKNKPTVYRYSSSLDELEFKSIKFENQEEYNVSFEYSINSDRKSDDLIVEADEKVYVFTAINILPLILNNVNEIPELFDNRISEVKDAF